MPDLQCGIKIAEHELKHEHHTEKLNHVDRRVDNLTDVVGSIQKDVAEIKISAKVVSYTVSAVSVIFLVMYTIQWIKIPHL